MTQISLKPAFIHSKMGALTIGGMAGMAEVRRIGVLLVFHQSDELTLFLNPSPKIEEGF